jgi:putative ABC transport system ATP-binding protein
MEAVPATSSASNIVSVTGVKKSYRRGTETVEVLRDMHLEIARGEFVVLMGPSGSGKTTLLNIVAGIDTADSGEVLVAGQNLSVLSEAQLAAWRSKTIGFIFQFYNLVPVLSALENVALPLTLFPMTKKEREERARFALEVVGLADRMKHFPRELSGGQEQRVAIARAIVTDPEILVADEPTGDLDRVSATDIMELLRKLNRDFHKTILMVSHDPAAAAYASRKVELDKGRLKA